MADSRVLESRSRLLNVKEAAEFLHVKESTIRQMVFKKKIPHIKVGALVRFTPDQILEYLEKNTVEETPNDKD
ncbi:MAG: helix-turn-helix domain-containing protein [Candidatus Brocadia sinica]|nr:helix-turn-helix domain-containing protein [Candidatus Brocadia sinica]NUO06921.1 helix-turn-helix domain-containing protein [Candidatus Brocadia sinica]